MCRMHKFSGSRNYNRIAIFSELRVFCSCKREKACICLRFALFSFWVPITHNTYYAQFKPPPAQFARANCSLLLFQGQSLPAAAGDLRAGSAAPLPPLWISCAPCPDPVRRSSAGSSCSQHERARTCTNVHQLPRTVRRFRICCGNAAGSAAAAFRAARCGLSGSVLAKCGRVSFPRSVRLSVRPVRCCGAAPGSLCDPLRGCCCRICVRWISSSSCRRCRCSPAAVRIRAGHRSRAAPGAICTAGTAARILGRCIAAPDPLRRSSAEVPARPLPSLWILSGIRVPSFPASCRPGRLDPLRSCSGALLCTCNSCFGCIRLF